MLDALNLAAVTDILVQPRTWELAAIILIGGVVRGFSGFGGALIFIPLASALVGPKLAIPIFYLIDLVTATPYGLRMIPKASLREVGPMLAGSWVAAPFGGWILVTIAPDTLRWATSIMVLMIMWARIMIELMKPFLEKNNWAVQIRKVYCKNLSLSTR